MLGNCVECECGGIHSLASVSDDGSKKAVMLANTGADTVVETELEGDMKAYLIDEEHFMTETECDLSGISIKKNQVILIKNY